MIITIDGPSASGKGTLSKRLAAHYCLPCLDTGSLYRILGLAMLRADSPLSNIDTAVNHAKSINLDEYDDSELRTLEVGEAASVLSAIPEVRDALLSFQKNFATQSGGAILDGRDCGSVIAPDADVKFFVTASPTVRARRRQVDLENRGQTVDLAEILADIQRRDTRDSSRSVAPLSIPDGAVIIDSNEMNVAQMVSYAIETVEAVLKTKPIVS